jgi:hypothetical protein
VQVAHGFGDFKYDATLSRFPRRGKAATFRGNVRIDAPTGNLPSRKRLARTQGQAEGIVAVLEVGGDEDEDEDGDEDGVWALTGRWSLRNAS